MKATIKRIQSDKAFTDLNAIGIYADVCDMLYFEIEFTDMTPEQAYRLGFDIGLDSECDPFWYEHVPISLSRKRVNGKIVDNVFVFLGIIRCEEGEEEYTEQQVRNYFADIETHINKYYEQ